MKSPKLPVLDLVSNTWSEWPNPPNDYNGCSAMIQYKDCLILFGGSAHERKVQTFNLTTHTWDHEYTNDAPIAVMLSSAVMSGQDEVLVAGSYYEAYQHSAAKYYPKTKSWERLEDSKVNLYRTRLAKLGERIFAIGGRHNKKLVQEFIKASNTWSSVEVKPIHDYEGDHSVLSLPASLFAHLPQGCIGVH